jgi:hypothetical protein
MKNPYLCDSLCQFFPPSVFSKKFEDTIPEPVYPVCVQLQVHAITQHGRLCRAPSVFPVKQLQIRRYGKFDLISPVSEMGFFLVISRLRIRQEASQKVSVFPADIRAKAIFFQFFKYKSRMCQMHNISGHFQPPTYFIPYIIPYILPQRAAPKRGRPDISYQIKKNVASDILAPSADATHLHIARVRI